MKTKYILIDYENIHTFSSADLSVLKEAEFMVKLFLGVHDKKIGVDLFDAMLPIGSRVEIIRLKAVGKNALDFMIAFHIGKIWCQEPEASFYIISKDTDYNALIKNLESIGVDVHQQKCIADVVKKEPAATPSMNDLVATATAALSKFAVTHRPSTQKKLRNVIEQLFKKQLSEEQASELMETLSKSGVVQVVSNKVKYNLPDPV